MDELALFAGAGGGLLGSELLGWRTRCAVEIDAYARRVLLSRQRDGALARFPIWDDIKTFDGKPWRGAVDVVSGGFPCQDIAACGPGAGLSGKRSGLFFEMCRVIDESRPSFVFAENSPMLRTRGLEQVICELVSLGYGDVRWCVLGARHISAPHKRDRMWILAHSHSARKSQPQRSGQEEWRWSINSSEAQNMAHSHSIRQQEQGTLRGVHQEKAEKRKADQPISSRWWRAEPQLGRVAHGVAHRVDRLRCIGNGQVPGVAALAFRILSQGLI